jgi:hypothetical protein
MILRSYAADRDDNPESGHGLLLNGVYGRAAEMAPLAQTGLQMMRRGSFADWDFYGVEADGPRDVWFMPEGDYPVLAWQTEVTGLVLTPRMTDRSPERIRLAITDAGLRPGVIRYDYDSRVPPGETLGLSPAHVAAPETPVDIVVSLGPYDWRTNRGDGTFLHPYEISTPGQLDGLTRAAELWDKCFLLTANLDLSFRTYSEPLIAPNVDGDYGKFGGTLFAGRFDGGGHQIDGLTITTTQSHAGLFGAIAEKGEVWNLGLRAALVTYPLGGGPALYGQRAGAVAGENRGLISGCFSTGVVMSHAYEGGLVGENSGSISNCYSTAEIRQRGSPYAGGVAGINKGTLTCCYTAGSRNLGIVGSYSGDRPRACFYLMSPGQTQPSQGMPLTDEQMRRQDSFAGWDFYGATNSGEGIWFMPDGEYPVLAWQTDRTGMAWLSDRAGMSLEERLASLESQGLTTGAFLYDHDNDVAAGSVIGTIPWGAIPRGSTVDILISEGPYDWGANPGDGTQGNPHQIESAGQLLSLADHPELYACWFSLTADLDMQGRVLRMAAIAPAGDLISPDSRILWFSGCLDGRNHKILNLVIRGGYASTRVGLLGAIDSRGMVRNVVIQDAKVSSGAGSSKIGILAGFSYGAINNCRVTGTVIAGRKSSDVGGLLGENGGSVADCHVAGFVTAGNQSSCVGGLSGTNRSLLTHCSADCVTEAQGYSSRVGGLCGLSIGVVREACATGLVSGDNSIGGLVGEIHDMVSDCYSAASVAGRIAVGGLVGDLESGGFMPSSLEIGVADEAGDSLKARGRPRVPSHGRIARCHAVGVVQSDAPGGLVGVSSSIELATDSYWDLEAAGTTFSEGGVPKTTDQMKQRSTFGNWDFEKVWTICEGADYPRLRWENVNCEVGP